MPRKIRRRTRMRGGNWRNTAGKLILKAIRGISGFLGGPTSFADARKNFATNTKRGYGRRSLHGRLRLN